MIGPKLIGGLLTTGLAILCAQAPQRAVFEAASVKPSDPARPESFWKVSPGRLTVQNMSLKSLIMAFYKVKQFQVTGGPRWMDTDRFDILAKLADDPAGASARGPEAAARLMSAAQGLLADRFHLIFREEARQLSGYSLVIAKSGFKFKPEDVDGSSTVHTGRGTLRATALSMERFASSLSTIVDAPVIDETALQGGFTFTLEWAPDEMANPTDPPSRPSLFTALQESLGLKLESRKVTAPVFVVERAEKPEAN